MRTRRSSHDDATDILVGRDSAGLFREIVRSHLSKTFSQSFPLNEMKTT
jgi:hypothetical protein